MQTIKILEKDECCGCSSCSQKCPKNAIKMIKNNEGFLYPEIDENLCVNCGLCVKACPQLVNNKEKADDYPKAYAMRNLNDNELKDSSSGGIFTAVSNYVLKNNGVVFGAAFDETLKVNHVMIDNTDDLNKLRGSKYVQSNINNTYMLAEKELNKNRTVLFSGTPCQIAGLKSYLMREYDNLITADLVCHGVPSQEMFNVYIEYLSLKFKSKVVNYNFRSKEKNGWGLTAMVETEDGKIRYIEAFTDPYYINFLDSHTYRESCYKCRYANLNRVSDITLADYWGIKDVHPEFYKKSGNSLILINTKKGKDLIEKISEYIDMIETDLNIASSYNTNLTQPSCRGKKRDHIYDSINENDCRKFVKGNLTIPIIKRFKAMLPPKLKEVLKKFKSYIK